MFRKKMKHILKLMAVVAISAGIFACSPKQQQETAEPVAEEIVQAERAYVGTFVGELPCADCSGISVELTLNEDGTFAQKEVYQGTDTKFETVGSYFLSPDGESLITVKKHEPVSRFQIMEQGSLRMLDSEGQEITGEMAAKYVLTKK